MIEKYLPIGTVVLLNEGSKRLMITGYCIYDAEKRNGMYDYCGVIYPEGLISTKQTLCFNHNQINKILYMGLMDQEFRNFETKLKIEINKNQLNN